jgi:hypothetical protein
MKHLKIQISFQAYIHRAKSSSNFFKVDWVQRSASVNSKIWLLVFASQTSVCNLPDFTQKFHYEKVNVI